MPPTLILASWAVPCEGGIGDGCGGEIAGEQPRTPPERAEGPAAAAAAPPAAAPSTPSAARGNIVADLGHPARSSLRQQQPRSCSFAPSLPGGVMGREKRGNSRRERYGMAEAAGSSGAAKTLGFEAAAASPLQALPQAAVEPPPAVSGTGARGRSCFRGRGAARAAAAAGRRRRSTSRRSAFTALRRPPQQPPQQPRAPPAASAPVQAPRGSPHRQQQRARRSRRQPPEARETTGPCRRPRGLRGRGASSPPPAPRQPQPGSRPQSSTRAPSRRQQQASGPGFCCRRFPATRRVCGATTSGGAGVAGGRGSWRRICRSGSGGGARW